ncbi:hypothetical protein CH64_84 [Yersinia rohdei]|uniref:Protein of uncharacterized function (DUF1471) n=1 Tax=Yersinia rohdei TaxID=29485 RepID=A0A0U1HSI5_YERRO|nr:DUF1471 domain-containing protein [Yersinia rohdei]AJJ09153.1 hypothetical protein CH64_84 [Yersinia rohdei]EEQ04134.1 hypothetical protein yrohd0001_37630 [Yersinia rohdei ATCC 43380]MDN0094501.1 DUF1471 domain-containing protein [Yersinia rohdei]OWF81738.1 hypothetical protein B4900_02085 [Yersinia rohdei]CNE14000.1 Protein of uncharacterised function (DUF1471) [Yersinia rohdei]
MKLLKSIIIITSLVSFSALAAQEITKEDAAKYTKSGTITVTEDGFTMSKDDLSKKVDEKGGKYYVITSEQGRQDHKTINADIYQ